MGRLFTFLSRNRLKIAFFFIYYVIIGTCSIWLPAFLFGVEWQDIAMGFLTIVLSVVGYAATEKILSIVSSTDVKWEVLINISAVVIPLIICVIISKSIDQGCKWWAISLSGILYVSSCVLWWYQNRDNKTFSESVSTLGGQLSQFN